jgi:hypothetical protein
MVPSNWISKLNSLSIVEPGVILFDGLLFQISLILYRHIKKDLLFFTSGNSHSLKIELILSHWCAIHIFKIWNGEAVLWKQEVCSKQVFSFNLQTIQNYKALHRPEYQLYGLCCHKTLLRFTQRNVLEFKATTTLIALFTSDSSFVTCKIHPCSCTYNFNSLAHVRCSRVNPGKVD